MISFTNIKHLHMEFSSICNARCPLCPRNLFGYPYNKGYEETSLSLDLIKKSFSTEFIKQINRILINGNFGDFTANMESLEIIEYFASQNNKLLFHVSTNGSARNADFWRNLGKIKKISVDFCLDGLEDTHHLYRQDTNFNKIINNAKIFIEAGGYAVWKMVPFEHNKHQIEEARQRSIIEGFQKFEISDHGRNTGPVFDRNGKLVHVMGNWTGHTDIKNILEFQNDFTKGYRYPPYHPDNNLDCFTKKHKSIYIAANGKVYPCCYMGFNPETYNKGWHGFINKQIAPLVEKNDLHHYSLEETIKWFSKIESAWTKTSTEDGRIIQCDITCGKLQTD